MANNQLKNTYREVLEKTAEASPNMLIKDFEPSPHHILVEKLPADERKKGIIIPEAAREPKSEGFVVRINPKDEGGLYALGDLVLFAQSSGTDVVLEDKPFLILQYHDEVEGEILGRWPKETLATEK